MAIGDVSASGGITQQQVGSNAGQVTAGIGQGVGAAIADIAGNLMNYASGKQQLELQWKARADATEDLEVKNSMLGFEQRMAEAYTVQARERSGQPLGFTNSWDEYYQKEADAFLKTLPDRVRAEAESRLKEHQTQQRNSAFQFELTSLDTRDKTTLNKSLNTIGTALKAGQMDFDSAVVEWEEAVSSSALPAVDKEALLLQGRQTIESLQFGTEVEMVSRGYGASSNPADGSDVVAAGLGPQERGLLNAIASKEGPSYDVLNGGERFSDYSDHPRRKGAGGTSTAAGRYQFIASTWDTAKASYEKTYGQRVPDFSPEWQDRVALHWAEVVYNRHNKHGLTFRQALTSNDPKAIATIRSTLGNPKVLGDPNSVEWQGLGDLYMSDSEFLSVFTGDKGVQGGGTGAASGPNPWTDPRFASLDLESKLRLGSSSAEAADRYRRAQAENLRKQSQAELSALKDLGAQTGNLNYIATLRKRPDFTEDMERQYRSGVDEYRKKEVASQTAGAAIAAGQPIKQSQMAGYREWFGEAKLERVWEGDSEARADMYIAAKTARAFPPGGREALLGSLANPAIRGDTLEFLAGVHTEDPAILRRSGFTDSDLADARTYASIAKQFPDQASALSALDKMKENAKMLGPEKLRKEAQETFTETVMDDLPHLLSEDWNSPELPTNQAESMMLTSDAARLYQEGYSIYADQEAATAYMTEGLKRVWGQTSVGETKEFSRHPPENYYPPMPGMFGPSFDYLSEAVRTAYSLTDDETFRLQIDATTELEVKAGKLPTYKVWKTGEDGLQVLLPGRWGGEAVTHPVQAAEVDEAVKLEASADSVRLFARVDQAWGQYEEAARAAAQARSVYGADSPEANAALIAGRQAQNELMKRMDSAEEVGYVRPPGRMLQLESQLESDTYSGMKQTDEERTEMRLRIEALSSGPRGESLRARVTYLQREGRDADGNRYTPAQAFQEALAESYAKTYKTTKGEALKLIQETR